MIDEGYHTTERTLHIGVLFLVALVCLQGGIGYQAHSVVLLATAAQTLAAVCVLVTVLLRLRARRLRTSSASFHHLERNEAINAMLPAVFVMVIGIQTAILSFKAVMNPAEQVANLLPILALVISMFVKEAMFLYLNRRSLVLGSKVYMTNARNRRADIFTSLIALAGLLFVELGDILGYSVFRYGDPLAAVMITYMIGGMGITIVRNFLSTWREQGIDVAEGETADFVAAVGRVHGVISVDSLHAREHGHYVVVELSISVNPRLSVWEGHEISRKIKQQLMKQYQHLTDVNIHVNPYHAGYPYKHYADEDAVESSVVH